MINKKIITILYFIFTIFCGIAKVYSPQEIKNPNLEDRTHYVADPANLLNRVTTEEINSILWDLRKNTSAEVLVALVPDIGDYPPESFGTDLFSYWRIGKSDKDNGLLILIVPDQKYARIITGYGLEGIIPDIGAKRILDRSFLPNMKKGDMDLAILTLTKDISNVLSDPVAAEEIKSKKEESWLSVSDDAKTENDIFLLMLLAIAFISIFIIPRQYKKLKKLKCEICKNKMIKLDDSESEPHLSPKQILEKNIESVNHEVWYCPQCKKYEIKSNIINESDFCVCPGCNCRALQEIEDHTLKKATKKQKGIGEKIFECKNCHYKDVKEYSIPYEELENESSSLAIGGVLAGTLLGAKSFFKDSDIDDEKEDKDKRGGLGGGRTGGGGAGVSW